MKKKEMLELNLQFFAEEPDLETPEGDAGVETSKTETAAVDEGAEEEIQQPGEKEAKQEAEKNNKPEEKADLTDLIQKIQAESKTATALAIEEALKVAAMTPEEKAAYEKEQKEIKLLEREQAILLRELQADTKQLLLDNELSTDLMDIVMGKNMEETKENLTVFQKKFDKAVQERVEERLKGKTPPSGSGINGSPKAEADMIASTIDKYL